LWGFGWLWVVVAQATVRDRLAGLTLDAPIRPPGDRRGSKIHCLADDRG